MSKKLLGALLVISLLAVPLVSCKGLTLTIRAPLDGHTLTTSPVIARGTVSDAKATVEVNDVAIPVDSQGNFKTTIEPQEGENTIKVVATRGKETVTKTVTVIYTPKE